MDKAQEFEALASSRTRRKQEVEAATGLNVSDEDMREIDNLIQWLLHQWLIKLQMRSFDRTKQLLSALCVHTQSLTKLLIDDFTDPQLVALLVAAFLVRNEKNKRSQISICSSSWIDSNMRPNG